MSNIQEIKAGKAKQAVKGTGAITSPNIREAKSKKKFLECSLADRTGSIKAKFWDYSMECPQNGEVFNFTAQIDEYNGEIQLVLTSLTKAEKYNPMDFVPSLSAEEMEYYIKKLDFLITTIKDKALRDFVSFVIYQEFPKEYFTVPGGKANHHACVGGLLQHSVNVTTLALEMAKAYKMPYDQYINRDLLVAGGLLHDIGKCQEYCVKGTMLDRTLEGTLMTHYDTNVMYLMRAWDKIGRTIPYKALQALMHYGCTHHGPELSERPPGSINAWLIHSADLADSFIDTITKILDEGVDENGVSLNFSKRLNCKVFDENSMLAESGRKSKG